MSVLAQPVSSVFQEIENYFSVDIVLSSNVDQSCKLTSPLAGNSNIDQIFDVMIETYDMVYEKQSDDSYIIKYLSCK